MKLQLRMNPEWNTVRVVEFNGDRVNAAASPYDYPSHLVVETRGDTVEVAFSYDFMGEEAVEATALSTQRMRIFRGRSSGRIMALHIKAKNLIDAAAVIQEGTEMIEKLASSTAHHHEPRQVRESIHLSAMVQALPQVGRFLQSRA